jgi:hypothetical protein
MSSSDGKIPLSTRYDEKCNDSYTFQANRMPTWIPDLIFKYQNTMNAL